MGIAPAFIHLYIDLIYLTISVQIAPKIKPLVYGHQNLFGYTYELIKPPLDKIYTWQSAYGPEYMLGIEDSPSLQCISIPHEGKESSSS